MKTILVEQYGFAGGIGTLCCCPIYFGFGHEGRQMTAGIGEEVVRRLDEMGKISFTTNNSPSYPDMQPIAGRSLTNKLISDTDSMRVVYNRMLKEAGVACLFYSSLVDAVVEEDRIIGALVGRIEGPGILYAKYFVDATGDALLVHYAGGETREYDQEHNMHKSLFFDMCNVGPYDFDYVHRRYRELFDQGKTPEGVLDHFMHTEERIPGVTLVSFGKTSGDALTSSGMTKMDQDLRAQQLEIAEFLRREMPGFQNAETVFTSIRVGVRAGRGIVGTQTLLPENIAKDSLPDNRVVLIDRSYGASHSNKKYFADDWKCVRGGISAVPMGALIAKSFVNVLSCGRSISSHPELVATFRMMNTCLSTGEAAGLIASLCIWHCVNAHELQYPMLKAEMEKRNFILE